MSTLNAATPHPGLKVQPASSSFSRIAREDWDGFGTHNGTPNHYLTLRAGCSPAPDNFCTRLGLDHACRYRCCAYHPPVPFCACILGDTGRSGRNNYCRLDRGRCIAAFRCHSAYHRCRWTARPGLYRGARESEHQRD